MKKSFKKKGVFFDDETNGISYHLSCFAPYKRFSKSQREKYLSDLGSDSETEFQSAKALCENYEWSPKLLDWLIEYCENERPNYDKLLHNLNFFDDKRIFSLILELSQKANDEEFERYIEFFSAFGGERSKEILRERFEKLSDNPQCFAWDRMKGEDGMPLSLLRICESLLKLEPDNEKVAECLIKLSKHPARHIKRWAIGGVLDFWRRNVGEFKNVSNLFIERLKELSKTNNLELFGQLIPFIFLF